MQDIVEYISAAGTALGAIVACFAAWDARRSARRQARETEKQQEETRKQALVAVEQLVSSHGQSVREWANGVIEAIGQSIALCHCQKNGLSEHEYVKERSRVVQRLSALLDQGRLMFPNVDYDQYGTHKPAAFRGVRQAVLDHIADAHDVTLSNQFDDPKLYLRDLIEARRAFVSEIQTTLDPRAQQQRLRQLAGDYANSQAPHKES